MMTLNYSILYNWIRSILNILKYVLIISVLLTTSKVIAFPKVSILKHLQLSYCFNAPKMMRCIILHTTLTLCCVLNVSGLELPLIIFLETENFEFPELCYEGYNQYSRYIGILTIPEFSRKINFTDFCSFQGYTSRSVH